MTPSPTVYVYVWLRAADGSAHWIRYVDIGDDHAAAVAKVTKNLRPSDVLQIDSFDGEPRTWRLDAEVIET